MITDIQQVLEAYKTALREYWKWLKPKVDFYDKQFGKGNWGPMSHWGGSEWDELNRRNAKLAATEELLGLTKEEITQIAKECGIENWG